MAEIPELVDSTGQARPRVPVLRTKLYIPQPPPGLVSRLRLLARLDEGMTRQLTLLSAPAGFGKSNLLSEWAHRKWRATPPLPVAWVSLDEGDNDPVRFWTYVVTALQTIQPGLGQSTLAALQYPSLPPIESLLTGLINEITAGPAVAGSGQAFALVLDDYHVIESQPIHDTLAFLLDHLPPRMRLVIASRADPPLPLARLRGQGQLIELRAADLRFSPDEAAAFLDQVMALALSEEEVAALVARTEGWIVGLQLAGLSMQGREDTTGFIASFTGSHHYVLDYLTEEVLERQPESVQSFLLQTAILDRMNGPLCNAVTGRDDGPAMLRWLEAANLFIVPLDDERHWYRYHRLFGDLLRNQLNLARPERIPTLHLRASEWCERKGLIGEAFRYALAAEDVERAARLAEESAKSMIWHGELTTLLRWLDAFPDEVVEARPRLCVYRAWALFFVGQMDEVEPCLRGAEKAFDQCATLTVSEQEVAELLDEIAIIRLLSIVRYQEDFAGAIELARQVLDQVPEGGVSEPGTAYLGLAFAFRGSGDATRATQAFAEALRLCQTAGNVAGAMTAAFHLTRLYEMQGQLHRAIETSRQMLRAVEERVEPDAQYPASGLAHIGVADVLYKWDELEAAEQHLQDAVALGERGGYLGTLVHGYLMLSRVKQARGDAQGARESVRKAEQIVQQRKPPVVADVVATIRTRLSLAQGSVEEAGRWVQSTGLSADDDPATASEFELITLARVLLAQGRLDEAGRLLERLLPSAEQAGRMGRVIEMLVLQGLTLQAQEQVDQALKVLRRVLSLAEPEGYVRVFVDEGTPMAELLLWGVQCGAWPEPRLAAYTGKLLTHFGLSVPESKSVSVEPLSERELQVLELVARGASNREIAQELVVSVNTVKTHMRSIFGKLEVKNRTQAVARARALHLLP